MGKFRVLFCLQLYSVMMAIYILLNHSTLNKGLLDILVCFDKLHEMLLAALSCNELHEYLWELFLVALILQ